MKKICVLTSLVCAVSIRASQVNTAAQIQTALAVCVSSQRIKETTLLRNLDQEQNKKIESSQKISQGQKTTGSRGKAKTFIFTIPLSTEKVVEPLAPAHKNNPTLPNVALVVKEQQQKREEETKKQEDTNQRQ